MDIQTHFWGVPQTPIVRKRSHIIPLRLNEREYRHLCEQVKISGLSREEYPVSYTHLDVYKRQVQHKEDTDIDKLADLLDEYVFPLAFDGMPADDAEIILNPSGKFVPVSYTHLDVYKRQRVPLAG